MKPQPHVEINAEDLKQLLKRLKNRKLQPSDYELLEGMIETWQFLCSSLEHKKITVKRLQRMLFGPSSEKSKDVLDGPDKNKGPPGSDNKSKPKGHGRNGAEAYWGADRVQVAHQSLKVGDRCEKCGKGKLYELKKPSRIVVFRGTAPIQATVYERQRLRCSACGAVFVAEIPAEAGTQKYDATAGSIVALLKYGNGMPFYRLGQLQKAVGVPLAPAVQWKLVSRKADVSAPIWEELLRQGAQGHVLHNDDTPVTILQLLKDRSAAYEHVEEEQQSATKERTGVFTTAILSSGLQPHTIALFHSGVRHAGENLQALLTRRDSALPTPILMCDALSRNLPESFSVILANCLAHGRRQFVPLVQAFPAECEYVLKTFKDVYRLDDQAKTLKLNAEQRLAYHIQHSKPLMDRFHKWMTEQFEHKTVEPNSSLGDAITYMQNHWKALTQFLRVPGAPLDNNSCERALKRAILNRKNSLFYKTLNGATVGDILMSIIYTCILCNANPFEYLNMIELHAADVAAHPQAWMPWNYREQIDPQAVRPSAA